MSQLCQNSQSAERKRGLVFSETFVSEEAIEANGGTITGNPSVDFGADLDGTNDYIVYTLINNELNTASISVVVEFIPDFAADDGNSHEFIQGTAARIIKYSDANNSIICELGDGTNMASSIFATYGAYWNTGGKNVIVLTGTSGANKLYLNGVEIGSGTVAWSPVSASTIGVGASTGGASKFDGKISKVQFYNTVLTAQEALDFYNNDTYNYRNEAVLDLPMGIEQHDVTNVRTLDVSKNASHAQLGDGSTSTTMPTKQTTHGYDFDGGDYMVATPDLNVGNTGSLSFIIEFTPDFNYDDNNVTYIYGSSAENIFAVIKQNNASSNILDIWFGSEKIDSITEATYKDYWFKDKRNILILSGTGGDGSTNVTQAWLNGHEIMNDTVEWYGGTDVTNLNIGSSYSYSNFFDGKIHSFQVYQRLITPLQVEDIQINSMKKANDI